MIFKLKKSLKALAYDILAFEVYIKGLIGKNKFSRFIDLVTQKGVHFEFKNWKNFKPGTFVDQLAKDFQIAGNQIDEFTDYTKWIFSGRIGTQDELFALIRKALRNEDLLLKYGLKKSDAFDLMSSLHKFIEIF